ncbi:MAG: DUF1292 domain-containing protein [Ruminococcus sp.]|nr:DUF1292 domain-containing protein [Ruminococcus sp.]
MADFINENTNEEEVIIIELTDEDGVSTEFEYLDTIQLDGDEYVVLIENVEDAEGVIVLRIDSIDDETENYVGVEDEEIVEKVYEIFKKNHKDDFEFTD